MSFLADLLLNQGHEVREFHRLAAAEIDQLVAVRVASSRDNSGDGVRNERPVSIHLPAVVQRDGLAGIDAVEDLERHHVGATPRPVDGEETNAGEVDLVEMV